MKILIVEDEKKTGEYLTKGLTEAGFVVDLADNGLNGYHLAMTSDYDLLILDIMLPDVNGWDIVRMLRAAGKGMPILLLTALGTIEHRVKGLELGADDYLVKPFAFAELLARVRTLLRRGAAVIVESQFQAADLSVDLVSRKVTRGATPTPPPPPHPSFPPPPPPPPQKGVALRATPLPRIDLLRRFVSCCFF
ncbi:response regulator, partial [Klebsiella pneumoniae]